MRIKIFCHRSVEKLEDKVNEFLTTLSDDSVIDIKYSSSTDFSEVLIMYH